MIKRTVSGPMRPAGPLRTGLQEFVATLPAGCVMAEIGCYAGESTRIFLAKAAQITCVDPWKNYLENANAYESVKADDMAAVEATFDQVQQECPDRIRKIKATSQEAVALFPDRTFDLVYIDASHEYLDVAADLMQWLPKVKRGGLIAGHDYHINRPGVPRAVYDILQAPDAVFPDGTWVKRVGEGPPAEGPPPHLQYTRPTSPKVLIGIPGSVDHAGFTPFNVALDLLMTRHPEALVFRAMGGVVPGARNRLVREAVVLGAEYLWFLDNDQPFFAGDPTAPDKPDDLDALLGHGVDAVVPLSCRRGNPFLPLLFSQIDDDGTYAVQRYLLPDDHGLIPIAAAGFAGLLIKVQTLLRMGVDGWFEFKHPVNDFDNYAEDINFYKKLEMLGVQLYCDLDVRFGHAITAVAYILRQQGQWMTVLADQAPFVAFPQPQHPLGLAFSIKQRTKQPLVPVG